MLSPIAVQFMPYSDLFRTAPALRQPLLLALRQPLLVTALPFIRNVHPDESLLDLFEYPLGVEAGSELTGVLVTLKMQACHIAYLQISTYPVLPRTSSAQCRAQLK